MPTPIATRTKASVPPSLRPVVGSDVGVLVVVTSELPANVGTVLAGVVDVDAIVVAVVVVVGRIDVRSMIDTVFEFWFVT
jgi:hypothetical protein